MSSGAADGSLRLLHALYPGLRGGLALLRPPSGPSLLPLLIEVILIIIVIMIITIVISMIIRNSSSSSNNTDNVNNYLYEY